MPAIAAIAVDWGTTHLRLWSVDVAGVPIVKRLSGEGMSTLKPDEFEAVLHSHTKALGAADGTPVVMCGMAGSRQGWAEAPYQSLPVAMDNFARFGFQLRTARHPVIILPGVARRDGDLPDVMRSEETQLAGLSALGHGQAQAQGQAYVCMPGTHTKWATLENGQLTQFCTSMTGELFHLLSAQSILRHSADVSAMDPADAAFGDAVREALAEPAQVVTKLFSLRASEMFGHLTKGQIASRLSGLLIGLDVAAALERAPENRSVIVVGGNKLGRAYCTALNCAGIATQEYDGEELALSGLTSAARQIWPERFFGAPAQKIRKPA